MRNSIRLGVVLFTCVSSLNVYAAITNSSAASVQPLPGKTMVYESYVSNDPNDCKEVKDDTVEFSGALSIYVGADTFPSRFDKPMKLVCEKGYVMVTMTTITTGTVVTSAAGVITNNGKAMCCPLKYRWAPASTPA